MLYPVTGMQGVVASFTRYFQTKNFISRLSKIGERKRSKTRGSGTEK